MKLYQKFKNDFADKNVLIFGLGLQGKGLKDAQFFAKLGADVRVTDQKKSSELQYSLEKLETYKIDKYTLGTHDEKDILWSDVVIRNPGVPIDSPFLQLARKTNKQVLMDESLFLRYFGTDRVIGITGTRGKTTTTKLVYSILTKAGFQPRLGGNLPGSACLPWLKKIKEKEWLILELSSWQLQGFRQEEISPHISVITTIYQDHLDRYKTMEEYIDDKAEISKHQNKDDFLILNKDFSELKPIASESQAQIIWFSKNDFPMNWKLQLAGKHNRENAAAALAVAGVLELEKEIVKQAVCNFKPVEFRLEKVAEIQGVSYINDTTSTTPAAGIAALKAVDKPIVLIAGGSTKNLDLEPFAKEIVKRTKKVVLLEGTATAELKNLIVKYGGKDLICGVYNDFSKAVATAQEYADQCDAVLLSPGCTSFGMFDNEFDRGRQFNKLVKELNNEE